MKKISLKSILLTLFFGLTLSATLFAQSNELSVKAGHPFIIGDTFLSQYNGIFNIGVSYGKPVSNSFILRFSFDYDRLNLDRPDVNANIYLPKIGLAYRVYEYQKFVLFPEIQVGYAALKFDSNNNSADNSQNGVSFWIGLNPRYRLKQTIDLAFSFGYQSAYLDKLNSQATNTRYNKELHSLSFSLQTIFHF